MSDLNRRAAIGSTALGIAAASQHKSFAKANQPTLRVAMIGGGRGRSVAAEFRRAGHQITTVCDVDESRLRKAQKDLQASKAHSDLRRVLEDPEIDAVIVATPDHWHAPAAILALEAGKHVYVEKPCAHNIREGRLLIEAVERTGKVCQVGTQTRSTPGLQEAIKLLHDGAIGEVKIAKAWNSQRRANIGYAKPSDPPAGFDYDLWVGPAPKPRFQTNRHHYSWHWWYDFGTGDAGNDGVHELDVATWGLNVRSHPVSASGYGSKLYFEDDQQFPDTQHVAFEYPDASGDERKKKVLLFENRIWTPYKEQGIENGVAFYGTEGYLIFAKKTGYTLHEPSGAVKREGKSTFSTLDHVRNFAAAISGDQPVNAPPSVGHLSASLAHFANIIARTGQRTLTIDPQSERITNSPEANQLVQRTYRDGHWAIPSGAKS